MTKNAATITARIALILLFSGVFCASAYKAYTAEPGTNVDTDIVLCIISVGVIGGIGKLWD